MNYVRVGVVGYGYWGPNLVRNIIAVPNAKFIGVCDIDKNKLKIFKTNYPGYFTASKLEELLTKIDYLIIATPFSTHFPIARSALNHGVHVMIEKPFTRTLTEALELKLLANKKHKSLFAGYTYLFDPYVQEIKKIINTKSFGKTKYYQSLRLNFGLFRKDANVIWDLATHDISILNYLFNFKPNSVCTNCFTNQNQIQAAQLSLSSADLEANINISWLSPAKIRQLTIIGSREIIEFNDSYLKRKLRLYGRRGNHINLIKSWDPAGRKEALYYEQLHFIDCIQKGIISVSGPAEALKITKILEMIEKSIKH